MSRAGGEACLPPTVFRLLEFLLENPGRVLSRQQLHDGASSPDIDVNERAVDVNIRRLRRSLVRNRETDQIRTVRGFGYAFEAML